MNLANIKVQSFVTNYDDKEANTIKGASVFIQCGNVSRLASCVVSCIRVGCLDSELVFC